MRALLFGVALAFLAMPAPAGAGEGGEAQWDGKPLAYWIGLLRETPKDPRTASPEWRKAPWALSRIGVAAIPALITTLGDPRPDVRLRAVRPLVAMGPTASDAAPALTARLKDDDARVRQWAAVALGVIGPPAVGAVADLTRALKDPEATVRQAAAAALGSLGSTDAIPALEGAADDETPAVQRAARLALERLRPPSPKP